MTVENLNLTAFLSISNLRLPKTQLIDFYPFALLSLHQVVNKIQSRKQSRKLGRYKMSSVYRIQVRHSTVLYRTVLYRTVLYCTILYGTATLRANNHLTSSCSFIWYCTTLHTNLLLPYQFHLLCPKIEHLRYFSTLTHLITCTAYLFPHTLTHAHSTPILQPSSRQCENAERVAGSGDAAKGAAALKGVTIPMFSAKGLAIKRSNGEVVTPFYFAYEDLREDWGKLIEQAEAAEEEEGATRAVKKLAAKPKVTTCLSSVSCSTTSSRICHDIYSPLLRASCYIPPPVSTLLYI